MKESRAANDKHLTLFEPPAILEAPDRTVDPLAQAATEDTDTRAQLATEMKPRTRLVERGPRALSSAELLAALMGGQDSQTLQLAGDLVNGAGGLAGLRDVSIQDLAGAGGMLPKPLSEARAAKILAAIELGVRLMEAEAEEPYSIASPADVHRLLAPRMRGLEHEEFVAVLLDTKNQVKEQHTICVGTLDACPVHPREVFRPAVKAAAAHVIVVHNHPGKDPTPSAGDRRVTARLKEAGETIGIELLDHVIIGGERYASLKELGMFYESNGSSGGHETQLSR